MCLSPHLGNAFGGGGSPKGLLRQLLVQVFTMDISKIEVISQSLLDKSHTGPYIRDIATYPSF